MDIIFSVVGKIGEFAITVVGHQLGYLYYYQSNMDNLINRIKELHHIVQRIQESASQARRSGEEINTDIKEWLSEAERLFKVAEKFLQDEGRANTRCSISSFPNLISRHQFSRKAKKLELRVVEFKDAVKLDQISYRPKQHGDFKNKDYMSFDSRNSKLMGILEALSDDDVDRIGVCGMAGVGKTALVKEVARQALEDKLFDDAAMIVVSKAANSETIQQELAEKLGLQFSDNEKCISVRRDKLRERLKDETKFLIILDDVWEKIALSDIGICFAEDKKKCKMVLTSRSQDVLQDAMDVKKYFQVELLLEEEAYNWFSSIVADSHTYSSDLQSLLATQIVKECGCLPIAILPVAHALKNKSLSVWRDALRQLQRPSIQGTNIAKVCYSSIELSYTSLENEDAKSLFLFCSLLEEDANIDIEYLMRCGFGWGLFESVYTCEEARDRVQALVNMLTNCWLLLGAEDESRVTMHDVVHDVGIVIASQRHMNNVKNNEDLRECLKKKLLQESVAISLSQVAVEYLPERLESPQLQLILMSNNESLLIPDPFFEETKELRVLNLSNCGLIQLPSSFRFLQNLQTLCLHNNCTLSDIALIGELENLEILDLSNSGIMHLPEQIGRLTHLRLLDLNNCSSLEVIEPNVISSLIHLEELYVKNDLTFWDLRMIESGQKPKYFQLSSTNLIEIMNLTRLTALHIFVEDGSTLPRAFFSGNLKRYDISVGNASERLKCKGSSISSKIADLNLINSSLIYQYGLETLLKISDKLHLQGLEGINNVVYELNCDGFPELKHFVLEDNNIVEYIVDVMDEEFYSCNVFPSLESLYLCSLMNLKKLCRGKLSAKSFGRLTVVEVEDCEELKSLFSYSTAKLLLLLKEIRVTNCMMMEVIVEDLNNAHSINPQERHMIEFSQFCFLRLGFLPSLLQFYSEFKKYDNSSIPLFNGKIVSFPKLESMELFSLSSPDLGNMSYNQLFANATCFQNLMTVLVEKCGFLKNLFSSSMAVNFMKLKQLKIRECEMMEEIVSMDEMMDKVLFPKLDNLWLGGLPNLTSFSTGVLIEFPSLTQLNIVNCPQLKILFNEQVAAPNLERIEVYKLDNLKMIWKNQLSTSGSSSKLSRICVSNCKNLENIFPCSMPRRHDGLRWLSIKNCDKLEEIFETQSLNADITPTSQLEWNKDPQGIVTFPNLHRILVWECQSLKNLFPLSVARGLLQLEIVDIRECGIEEIVSKEKEMSETTPPKFVFPQLFFLRLDKLPKFVTFYPGQHTSEWPSLTTVSMIDCPKVKLFASGLVSSSNQEKSLHKLALDDISFHQTIFSTDKVNCLEFLKLKGCLSLNEIWQSQSSGKAI